MNKPVTLFFALPWTLTLACGGGGGGGGGGSQNFAGTWNVTTTVVSSTCGELPGTRRSMPVILEQTGQDVRVLEPESFSNPDKTLTGTATGNTVLLTRVDGSLVVSLTLAGDGSSFSGTAASSQGAPQSCSSNENVAASRLPGPAVDFTGTWELDIQFTPLAEGCLSQEPQHGILCALQSRGIVSIPDLGDLVAVVTGDEFEFGFEDDNGKERQQVDLIFRMAPGGQAFTMDGTLRITTTGPTCEYVVIGSATKVSSSCTQDLAWLDDGEGEGESESLSNPLGGAWDRR